MRPVSGSVGMAEQYGWDDRDKGQILSAFLFG